jgi:hypothetical protein
MACACSGSRLAPLRSAHPTTDFPLAEIGRAEIVPDDADALEAIVTMGSSVRYRLKEFTRWDSVSRRIRVRSKPRLSAVAIGRGVAL